MNDELLMERCIQLALNGKGRVSPNPLVGSVIAKDGKIIGEGWHAKAGAPHAEVNAIYSVKDISQLEGATIYINLEPCSHYGKTPPCADLIVTHKFGRAVIGSLDPNPLVAGKGIERLKNAGIEVVHGVLKDRCDFLNRRFFTFHTGSRPFIVLKWAQSQDGFMDLKREKNKTGIHWITHPQTKLLTHQWRTEEDAILAGTRTILVDDPELTVRAVKGKDPIRLVIDREGKIDPSARVFRDNNFILYTNTTLIKKEESENEVGIVFKETVLQQILNDCYERGIQSVFVEGGVRILQSFIRQNLWDEARVITGALHFLEGLEAPQLHRQPYETFNYSKDVVNLYFNDLAAS